MIDIPLAGSLWLVPTVAALWLIGSSAVDSLAHREEQTFRLDLSGDRRVRLDGPASSVDVVPTEERSVEVRAGITSCLLRPSVAVVERDDDVVIRVRSRSRLGGFNRVDLTIEAPVDVESVVPRGHR